MVVVQLTGGLGNQMFQYAAAKALSLHHGVPLALEISSFYKTEYHELEMPRDFELGSFPAITEKTLRIVDIQKKIDTAKPKRFYDKLIPAHKKAIYIEPYFHYDKNFFNSKKEILLAGGWQSEKYFLPFKNEIKSSLGLNTELVKNVLSFGNELRSQESLAIHVRRGDYLRKKIIHEWHGVMEKEYYLQAIEIITSKTDIKKIFFFTDDSEWVKKTLIGHTGGEIVSGNIAKTHHEDFYLMSQCKHCVIANSSFSWWAAWCNSNPGKIVVGPKKWFGNGPKDTQDIIPDEWIKI